MKSVQINLVKKENVCSTLKVFVLTLPLIQKNHYLVIGRIKVKPVLFQIEAPYFTAIILPEDAQAFQFPDTEKYGWMPELVGGEWIKEDEE